MMSTLLMFAVAASGYGQTAPSSLITNTVAYSLDSVFIDANIASGGDTLTTGSFEIQKLNTGQTIWNGPTEMFDTSSVFPTMYSFGYNGLSLEEITDYRIRLNTTNSQGNHSSGWVGFTTPLAPGAPVITNVELVNTTIVQSTVRVHYATLNAATLSLGWDYDGFFPYNFSAGSVPVVGVGYHDFILATIADTSVFTHAVISGQGINSAEFDFVTPQIVKPIITSAGLYSKTDSSAVVYVVGNTGSAASGIYVGNLVGGASFAPQSATTGDTALLDIPGLVDSTNYTARVILNTIHGSDTVWIDFTTDTIIPVREPILLDLSLFSVTANEIGIVYATNYSSVITATLTELIGGCTTTDDQNWNVGRGIDTLYLSVQGTGSIDIVVSIQDSLGFLLAESIGINLGSAVINGPSFVLDDSNVITQAGQHITRFEYYNTNGITYNIYAILADQDYNPIDTVDLMSESTTLSDGNYKFSFIVPYPFTSDVVYMQALGIQSTGLGPCGQGAFTSNWITVGEVSTGINNNTPTFEVKAYPNPSIGGKVHLESQEAGTLFVSDFSGKNVHTQAIDKGTQIIAIQNYNVGMYIFTIVNPKGLSIKKIQFN